MLQGRAEARQLGLRGLTGIHEAVLGIHGADIESVVEGLRVVRVDRFAIGEQDRNLKNVHRLAGKKGAVRRRGFGFVVMFDVVV